jgi:hypothetical protein
MSDSTNPVNTGDSTANAGQESGDASIDSQSVGNEGSHSRILEESKKYKARMIAAEKELEAIRRKTQETQGQFKELYEAERAQKEELLKKQVRQTVRSAVDEVAKKTGCIDVDALMKLGNPELLEYNQENDRVYGVDLFVEEAKKKAPYLFSASRPPIINPTSPGGIVSQKKLTASEAAKLPKDQLNKILVDLAKKTNKF